MKSKRLNKATKNTLLRSVLLLLLTGLLTFSGLAQQLTPEIKIKLEVVSHYIAAAEDNTDQYLSQLGYRRPDYIPEEVWKDYPAIRKMEMAYKAAAVNQQGKEFVEAMSKLVAKEYNSLKSETALASHFVSNRMPTVSFTNPTHLNGFDLIIVDPSMKKQIWTVGKYVNEGALGSLQNVMKNYLNLNEDLVYDILSKSGSKDIAFEQGLLRSQVPPPHEAKLARMAEDMQTHFKGLEKDTRLTEIARQNKKRFSFVAEEIKPAEIPPVPLGGGSSGGVSLDEYKQKYRSSYVRHRNYEKVYKTSASRKFSNMVRFKGGHGGVILGDSVRYNPKTRLVELRWMPINNGVQQDDQKIGYLELQFAGESVAKLYGPVLYEDVFAANAVVNDTRYQYGNGIGMVSIIDTSNISFSSSGRRFGITLHPAVSHLRLGWAFVVVDALAVARTSFEKALESPQEIEWLRSFYKEGNGTWKVTDKKIRINTTGNKITFDPVVLTMWGFRDFAETPSISPSFSKLLPSICKNVDEFNRVNEFAKVLSLFRWAKEVNSKISNITTFNSFIRQPVCVYVNEDDELKFPSQEEDRKSIQKEKDYFRLLFDSSANDNDRAFATKVGSLQQWFQKVTKGRESWWPAREPNSETTKSVFGQMDAEDTTGLSLMDDIALNFSKEWTALNIRVVNPDSVLYYQQLSSRVTKTLQPLQKIRRAADSLNTVFMDLLDEYGVTDYNSIRFLSEQRRARLIGILSALDEFGAKYKQLAATPAVRAAEKEWLTMQRFKARNKLVTMADLYQLLQAEKKVIKDYYE